VWASDIRASVEEYVALSKRLYGTPPADVADWLGVLQELENFLEACRAVHRKGRT
jgi:hypothetical protein